ncbi:MAG: hypothetical protein HUK21_04740, partial [Fibrobacteraceae bacterium]|nr:hypothetical protein [Fibrobacteraceae bacterium]
LIVFYILLNAQVIVLDMVEKCVFYGVVLAVLGLYWKVMKKKMEADKNSHS